ncbi:MAG: cytochrome P450 [Sandaracinus sp.]
MRAFDEIPGPPPASTLPAAYALMKEVRKDLLGLVLRTFEEMGDVFRLEVLGRKQVLVRAPAQNREVLLDHASAFEKGKDYTDRQKGLAKFGGAGLVTSNGDFWKRQRRLVAPALHAKRIVGYGEAMVRAGREAMASWKEGDVVEMDQAMMATALEIVARTMFSTTVAGETQRIADATHALHGMFEANNSAWTLLPAWFPTLQRMREDRAVATLDEIVYRMIRERRPTPEGAVRDSGDLACMLLSAEDEDGSRMTDVQARDEMVTMFVAGHETAANTLAWAWICLAREPAIRAALDEELARVLGPAGPDRRLPEAADVRALRYTEAVIKETLRLFPPAFTMMRTAIADTSVGGYAIPRGTDVSLVPYATHRAAHVFPDPTRFDPTRFLGEAEPDRFAWIPFGGGPRVCVGNAFALMETTLVLATIASRFAPVLAEGCDPRPVPGVTLRPSGPLRMRLEAAR